MSFDDWVTFIQKLKESIFNNPDQYLDNELPKSESLKSIINTIFDEFIQNEFAR